MAERIALLAGASGLVGKELLRLLCENETYGGVHSLVRKPSSTGKHARLTEHVVDFAQLPSLPHCDDVFIALGTTLKVAGSQQAFRRVDYDYVVAVAEAGRRAGASRLGVVSALGADATSRFLYNRVKGEMEAAVQALGYASVVIVQPSLLIGDREALGQPTRTGELWARRLLGPISGLVPAAFRPVRSQDVADRLLRAVLAESSGTRRIPSRELHGD